MVVHKGDYEGGGHGGINAKEPREPGVGCGVADIRHERMASGKSAEVEYSDGGEDEAEGLGGDTVGSWSEEFGTEDGDDRDKQLFGKDADSA